VEEAAEQVAPMNAGALILADELHGGGRVWWSQSQRPMRPMPVVMVDVDPEHSLEMLSPDDQQPVNALGATVRIQRSA
jgi:hypothetical protein